MANREVVECLVEDWRFDDVTWLEFVEGGGRLIAFEISASVLRSPCQGKIRNWIDLHAGVGSMAYEFEAGIDAISVICAVGSSAERAGAAVSVATATVRGSMKPNLTACV